MIIFQIELDYLTGGFSSAAESPFGFFAKTCKVINGNDSSQFVSMISDEVLRSDSDIDMNTSLEYKILVIGGGLAESTSGLFSVLNLNTVQTIAMGN